MLFTFTWELCLSENKLIKSCNDSLRLSTWVIKTGVHRSAYSYFLRWKPFAMKALCQYIRLTNLSVMPSPHRQNSLCFSPAYIPYCIINRWRCVFIEFDKILKKIRKKWSCRLVQTMAGLQKKYIYSITVGDESWIYTYESETKQQSTVRCRDVL